MIKRPCTTQVDPPGPGRALRYPYTVKYEPYTAVFCRIRLYFAVFDRITWLRITVVNLRVVIRWNTIKNARKAPYFAVYDTEIYDRNTEPGNTVKYGDLLSYTTVYVRPGNAIINSYLMLYVQLHRWIWKQQKNPPRRRDKDYTDIMILSEIWKCSTSLFS